MDNRRKIHQTEKLNYDRKNIIKHHKKSKPNYKKIIILITFVLLCVLAIYFLNYKVGKKHTFVRGDEITNIIAEAKTDNIKKEEKIIKHIKTPENVKGIYISSWVAGTKDFRDRIISLIDTTELNTVVIDVKDSSGNISFYVPEEEYKLAIGENVRIKDIDSLIKELHDKNIYIIARIAVFQDPIRAKQKPELAITSKSTGSIWKDRAGLSWIDASSKEQWNYVLGIAKYSYSIGFDEVNFDYVRYPSDGNLSDMNLKVADGENVKLKTINEFFAFIGPKLKEAGIPSSVDIFGLTVMRDDDLGIGQKLEPALKYFDFVSPMSYPSHFGEVFTTFSNPNSHPYETIKQSYKQGLRKIDKLSKDDATSKNPDGTVILNTDQADKLYKEYVAKLRPWYQDFTLGVTYDAPMVEAQIRAGKELGINSWLLWDPKNVYTKGALKSQ